MERLSQVMEYVKFKHQGQLRRNGESYYTHLQEVSDIAAHILKEKFMSATEKDVEDIKCASLLHDILEDTRTDYEDVCLLTCPKIANWVSALSDDKRLPQVTRLSVYKQTLSISCMQIKLIKLADLYSNTMSLPNNEDNGWKQDFFCESNSILDCLESDVADTLYYKELKHVFGAVCQF